METWILANRSWDSVNPVFEKLDVAGINYTQNIYPDQHSRFPTRVILSTETYPRDAFVHWSLSQDNPYVIGEFVWTAIDYLGESGIGRNYPPGQARSTTPTAASFPITPPTAATSISPASASRFRTTATSSGTTVKNSTSPCRNPVPTVDRGSAPNGLSRADVFLAMLPPVPLQVVQQVLVAERVLALLEHPGSGRPPQAVASTPNLQAADADQSVEELLRGAGVRATALGHFLRGQRPSRQAFKDVQFGRGHDRAG